MKGGNLVALECRFSDCCDVAARLRAEVDRLREENTKLRAQVDERWRLAVTSLASAIEKNMGGTDWDTGHDNKGGKDD